MRYIFVPHLGHVPVVAGFPFFIVICFGFCISLWARHLRQYACIRTHLLPFDRGGQAPAAGTTPTLSENSTKRPNLAARTNLDDLGGMPFSIYTHSRFVGSMIALFGLLSREFDAGSA